MPWSPIAVGMLAGRYPLDQPFPEGSRAAANPQGIYAQRINRRGLEVASYVPQIAATYGLSPAQISLLWVKDQPGITAPIIGCRTLEQLAANLKAADVEITDDDRGRADQLAPPGTAVSNFYDSNVYFKLRTNAGLRG